MIGKTLGHYQITGELGRGGMGQVYSARDQKLGREVALKVLPPDAAGDAVLRSRLEHEARAVASLQHPHIVTLYAVEEDRDRLFLAMELVRGPTFAELIARGPMAPRTLLARALPLAEAVGAAHRRNIVHRDLKPTNVMVDDEDRVKVLDFGLAKDVGPAGAVDETVAMDPTTTQGTFVGTVRYASPEQAQGGPVDARSDVFSLGTILYEMATGETPFRGDNPVAALASILKDPPDLSALPSSLARIIGRCLEKDPERRYPSANELRDDLAALQLAIDSGAGDLPLPARSRSRRRVVVPVLISLGLLAWILTRDADPPPTPDAAAHAEVVVVFPFENLGRDEDRYFAEGMTDEIMSRLSTVPGIGVISRSTTMQYDRTGKSLAQIGEDLGVGFVLEGTVRWDRSRDDTDRVRITPQLVRVADGTSAWSGSFDRDLDDVFAMQAEIASQVVSRIDASLAPTDAGNVGRTPDLAAYDYFLRARELVQWGFGPSGADLARGIALLDSALVLDGDFALAHAHLSMAHSAAWFTGQDRTPERVRLAEAEAQRALDLRPTLAEAHLAEGLFRYRIHYDFTTALASLRRAAQLAPGNAEIQSWIGTILKRQGRFDEAAAQLRRALRLDPRNPTTLGEVYVVALTRNDFEGAMQVADRQVELEPTPRMRLNRARVPLYASGDPTLIRALYESTDQASGYDWALLRAVEGDLEGALASLDASEGEGLPIVGLAADDLFRPRDAEHQQLFRATLLRWRGDRGESEAVAAGCLRALADRGQDATIPRAVAHSLRGEAAEAYRGLERYRAERTDRWDIFLEQRQLVATAQVQTYLGETEAAIGTLDRLLTMGRGLTAAFVAVDPTWTTLRDEPAFGELLARHRPSGS